MHSVLDGFSDEQLLEELVRRSSRRERAMPESWCDNCKNFVPTYDENANPCSKGHKMSFFVPQSYDLKDYGFYRRVCVDRDEAHADDA